MTINFFEPSEKHPGEGLCQAFDRREAATCTFYLASANGWCQHTRKDYHYSVPDGKNAYGRPMVKESVKNGMVSGVCLSEDAAKNYEKEKMVNGTETTCQ